MWVCIFLVWTRETICYQNCLTLAKFLVSLLCLCYSMFKSEKSQSQKYLGWHVRKESIIDVQCRQENPNPRVRRSSGKLRKPRFQLERWTLGLVFSCLHWTPMMDPLCPMLEKLVIYYPVLFFLLAKSVPFRLSRVFPPITKMGHNTIPSHVFP